MALELRIQGRTYWLANATTPDGSSNGTYTWAGQPDVSFEDWSQREVAQLNPTDSAVGPDVWPGIADLDLVTFVGDTPELAPVEGVTILDQRAVGRRGRRPSPARRTARRRPWPRRPTGRSTTCSAAPSTARTPQFIAVPVEEVGTGEPDLDAFLDMARERYAEGGGGLL